MSDRRLAFELELSESTRKQRKDAEESETMKRAVLEDSQRCLTISCMVRTCEAYQCQATADVVDW